MNKKLAYYTLFICLALVLSFSCNEAEDDVFQTKTEPINAEEFGLNGDLLQ
jgi:hypothetical protein